MELNMNFKDLKMCNNELTLNGQRTSRVFKYIEIQSKIFFEKSSKMAGLIKIMRKDDCSRAASDCRSTFLFISSKKKAFKGLWKSYISCFSDLKVNDSEAKIEERQKILAEAIYYCCRSCEYYEVN